MKQTGRLIIQLEIPLNRNQVLIWNLSATLSDCCGEKRLLTLGRAIHSHILMSDVHFLLGYASELMSIMPTRHVDIAVIVN